LAQLKLNTDNQTVLITRTIEQAPSKNSMLRELTKNALEAIASTTFAPNTKNYRKEIQIRKTDPKWFGLNGYSPVKFGIWNTGNGMSANELRKATDLASSIHKTQGTKNNFGIGAKVSTLGVNQTGVIWASCKDGQVNLVLLRKAHDPKLGIDAYERMDFPTDSGGIDDVYNITPLFTQPFQDGLITYESNPSGLTVNEDWTYIVLCGNDVHQNTCEDPYDENGRDISKGWALAELYKRFAEIPEDVYIYSEIHNRGESQSVPRFKTVEEDLKYHSEKYPDNVQYECVTDSTGIKIHYYWDGPSGTKANEKIPTTVVNSYSKTSIFSALKFKGEFFDIRGGASKKSGQSIQWSPAAKECGIFYGHEYVRVYLEIPNDFDVIQDQYRTRLLADDASKDEIKFTSYASEIYKNIPQWLKDRMNEYAPKPMDLSDVQNELQKYMDSLAVKTSAIKTVNVNVTPSNQNKNTNSTTNNSSKKVAEFSNTKKGQITLVPALGGSYSVKKKFPSIVVLNTEREIKSASVCDTFIYKAAEYVQGSNSNDTLFINGTYDSINYIVDDLMIEYQQHPMKDQLEKIAYETSVNYMTQLVGTALVHGLTKKGTPGYTHKDFETVTDPASLTTHADKWKEKIKDIQAHFKKQIVHLLKTSEMAEQVNESLTKTFNLFYKEGVV
jgi:hypothetical protein